MLRSIKDVLADDRPRMGQVLNHAKSEVEEAIGSRRSVLEGSRLKAALEGPSFDITQPGTRPILGAVHPIEQVRRRLERIFTSMLW